MVSTTLLLPRTWGGNIYGGLFRNAYNVLHAVRRIIQIRKSLVRFIKEHKSVTPEDVVHKVQPAHPNNKYETKQGVSYIYEVSKYINSLIIVGPFYRITVILGTY